MDLDAILESITRGSEADFGERNAVLSFREYLELVAERPYSLTRNSAQYLRDIFDFHGATEEVGIGGRPVRRWHLFDDPAGGGYEAVYGHESVQGRLYEILSEFVERGRADKLILLHGPNGSAKSSIVSALVSGLEDYSRRPEGQLFRFSWIFCASDEKPALGFGGDQAIEELESYARVDQKLISSRLPCEMRDPPFFLLPEKARREFLEGALKEAPEEQTAPFHWTEFITRGQLSPKNRVIYESLLKSYGGDWTKVMRHVRVERYEISQRYRQGAVMIEPQATIDAGARLLAHSSSAGLPPVLVHENLVEASGDLVDANGGVVEYSDFLKRSMEANKYLLTTAERGFVNLPQLTVSLNLILFGSTNEKYLSAFKRDPAFPSYKGRFELVRVGYLREYPKEARIYERHLRRVLGSRHLAPHTALLAALWAVLTRLRRPSARHFEELSEGVLDQLDPRRKAELYASGDLPPGLEGPELRAFRDAVPDIVREYDSLEEKFEDFIDSAFEGRRGASAREMMAMLTEVAVSCDEACIGPVQLFEALPKTISDPTLYAYLRIAPDGPWHNPQGFIDEIRREYVRRSAEEIRQAADLVEEREYLRLFLDYLQNVRALETGEKLVDEASGEYRDPDLSLMEEVEEHLGVGAGVTAFRQSLITKAAAWKLSNPDKDLVVEELFRDHLHSLERSFFRAQLGRVEELVADTLAVHDGGGGSLAKERLNAARALHERLLAHFGYCSTCLGAMLSYFVGHSQLLRES